MSSNNQKKTIKINPELFNISDKTKKNREKKSKPISMSSIVNPNLIKKQLLNRIKEHKTKEQTSKTSESVGSNSKSNAPSATTPSNFTDEFNDSISYLSSLSKKHKEDKEKEREKERKKEMIANRTVKNIYQPPSQPVVNLELPDELKEEFIPVIVPEKTPYQLNLNSNQNVILPKTGIIQQDVPYGCLKTGTKPTFRTWQSLQATRKNYDHTNHSTNYSSNAINTNIQPVSISNERERKLEMIKNKMKQDDMNSSTTTNTNISLEPMFIDHSPSLSPSLTSIQNPVPIPVPIDTSILNPNIQISQDLKKELDSQIEPPGKKVIKKTIRKTYTLGKSKMYNKVSILLKNNQTKKNVLEAQKKLKSTPILEIKNYLKTRGLIKVGSNAPNDVIRKTYESAMLTGEVINKNKDTLLHNFLTDTKE